MKMPRDVNGGEIVSGLRRVGYFELRQKGSHVYMETQINGEHHVAVPLHDPVKPGTLSSILASVAGHLRLGRDELLRRMKL